MKFKQEDAEDFFIEFFSGKHHFPSKMKDWGEGWCINSPYDLSTFDGDALTRLVVMAHERCVRVELKSAGLHGIKIIIHQRQRTGKSWERHPTLEGVLCIELNSQEAVERSGE